MSTTEEEKALLAKQLRAANPNVRPEDRERELELTLKQHSIIEGFIKIHEILETRKLSGRRRRELAGRVVVLDERYDEVICQLERLDPTKVYTVLSNDGTKAHFERPGSRSPSTLECYRDKSVGETESQFLARFPVGSKVPPSGIQKHDLKELLRTRIPSLLSLYDPQRRNPLRANTAIARLHTILLSSYDKEL